MSKFKKSEFDHYFFNQTKLPDTVDDVLEIIRSEKELNGVDQTLFELCDETVAHARSVENDDKYNRVFYRSYIDVLVTTESNHLWILVYEKAVTEGLDARKASTLADNAKNNFLKKVL